MRPDPGQTGADTVSGRAATNADDEWPTSLQQPIISSPDSQEKPLYHILTTRIHLCSISAMPGLFIIIANHHRRHRLHPELAVKCL